MSDDRKKIKKTYCDPAYRLPQYDMLSDLVAGRIQAGPQSTPPREGTDLDHWQDPELFHSPEL